MPRNVLESLVIILIALTFGMILVLPKYEDTNALREKVQIKKADLENRENYFEELEKISKEFKNNKENLDKIKTALPIGPMTPSLANFIQSASSQSGLILKNFLYGSTKAAVVDETAARVVQEYEIGLTLSGSYPAFKDFLDKIEKSSRLIEIQDISFTVSERSKSDKVIFVPPADNAVEEGETNKQDSRIYEFVLKLKTHYY